MRTTTLLQITSSSFIDEIPSTLECAICHNTSDFTAATVSDHDRIYHRDSQTGESDAGETVNPPRTTITYAITCNDCHTSVVQRFLTLRIEIGPWIPTPQ